MAGLPRFDRLGMVARWKPVHLGHAAVLAGLCAAAREVIVGIGSCNRYDARNPFTADETREMLRLALAGRDNWSLLELPDLDDGPRWSALVASRLGRLDAFVTDNPYVAGLMRSSYPIVRPVELVPEESRVPLDGTAVRLAMARGEAWRELVPEAVARYIVERGLDARFREQFGLETLAALAAAGEGPDVLVG